MNRVRVVNVKGLNRPDQRAAVVYVGRAFAGWPAHPLGNPFKAGQVDAAGRTALDCYRDWLHARPSLDADLASLWTQTDGGRLPLGCWCCEWDGIDPVAPIVCHAMILASVLNERYAAAGPDAPPPAPIAEPHPPQQASPPPAARPARSGRLIDPLPTMTPAEIAEELRLFIAPNQITELRAKDVGQRGRIFAGWFDADHLELMAKHAAALARESSGVYFIPNPIDPALLDRRPNRVLNVNRGQLALTRDADIVERRFFIVDVDPARGVDQPQGQDGPTSAREVVFARHVARAVIKHLRSHGFADPVAQCSGNGIHLVYRSPLVLPGGKCGPHDPVAGTLRTLADLLSCYGATIDPNTYTPARMLKVPGTLVRKGEAAPGRPHRPARILAVPHDWQRPEPVRYPDGCDPGAEPVRVVPDGARPVVGEPQRQQRSGRTERSATKRAERKPVKPAVLFDVPGEVKPH